MLDIRVSEPEQHGTVVDAYVDYKVSTSTDLTRFAQPHFFVRRRFRDFQWLREQLCATFPAAVIPPLPQVDSLLKDDRFGASFIQRRQAGLELFLRRVARHAKLSTAPALVTFLEAKMWELQTAKSASSSVSSASASLSWMSALFDGTDASLIKIGVRQERPDEERMSHLRAYVAAFTEHIAAAAAARQTSVNTIADAAADLNLLGRAGIQLSQSETELSLPFTRMASTADAQRRLLEESVQQERTSGLSALLTFNAGMAASLKTVITNRDRALDTYQKAQALLETRRAELEAWRTSQATQENEQSQVRARPNTLYGNVMSGIDWMMEDPKKGERLQQKFEEAQEHHAEAQQAWEDMASSIHDEAASFRQSAHADLASVMRAHVKQQIDLEVALQDNWRQLLEVFKSVPDVFDTTPLPGSGPSYDNDLGGQATSWTRTIGTPLDEVSSSNSKPTQASGGNKR